MTAIVAQQMHHRLIQVLELVTLTTSIPIPAMN